MSTIPPHLWPPRAEPNTPEPMNLDLTARHALVCGASAGIGRATALELAKLGATVTGLARRQDRLHSLVQEIQDAGGTAHALAADLDDRDRLEEAVSAQIAAVGPVTVLINNTGGPPGGPILEASEDAFLAAFQRHVLSAHRLTRLVLPGMRQAGFGRIINVISTSVREPIPNLGVSNTIRAAMAGWAKTVAMELPPGVTINNVLPGYTDTERLGSLAGATATRQGSSPEAVFAAWAAMAPEGRIGRPEELAAVIAFLASPAASFVRGVSLAVDGGRTRSI